MTDIYEIWKPIEDDPNNFNIEGLHNDYEGFRIIMRTRKPIDRVLKLSFDAPLLFRSIDEGDRLKLWSNETLITKYTFFRVKNSSLIEWLTDESLEVRKTDNLAHYLIASSNDIIDVICHDEPTAKWL